jgi:hypothetical protein
MLTEKWWNSLASKIKEVLKYALPIDENGDILDKLPAWEVLGKLTILAYRKDVIDLGF